MTIDLKMVSILQKDARTPNNAVATAVSIAPSAGYPRLSRKR